MTKDRVRLLKSHYGVRWTAFRHNRKNPNKILPIEEKVVTNNVLPGRVLAHNCLGEMYQDLFDVVTVPEACSTVILINPLEFKYQTPQQIVDQLSCYRAYLLPNGRIIANVDTKFLIYHRLCLSRQTLCNKFKQMIAAQGFDTKFWLIEPERVSHGYGDLFLIMDSHG